MENRIRFDSVAVIASRISQNIFNNAIITLHADVMSMKATVAESPSWPPPPDRSLTLWTRPNLQERMRKLFSIRDNEFWLTNTQVYISIFLLEFAYRPNLQRALNGR